VILIQRLYFENIHLFITPTKWCMGNHNIAMCLLYETADGLCATVYQLYANNCWGWQLCYSQLARLVGAFQFQQRFVLKNIQEVWAVKRIFIHWLTYMWLLPSGFLSREDEMCNSFLESWNHRLVWIGRDRKDRLVPTHSPWAGTPCTRPGCSKPHPSWLWELPGRDHPQLL